MTASQPTDVVPSAQSVLAHAPDSARRDRALTAVLARPALRHAALVPVLVLSATLNMHRLSQNGYANIFYSGGVSSMLRSLHNFLFVSFDPSGLVMVDKPPLGLWLQTASAKLFGFAPLSLLLPEAIAGVLAVALLYLMLERRFGWLAGLAGALALAVFPSFVAVSRDNGVDSLLILLMILACEAGLRASENGSWRALLASAVFVGLAFNTKTLAAYLVVPGIALAYLVCAPPTPVRRIARLAAAGVVMLAVSLSWIAVVELTPASQRPFVGGSTDNTELGLTFEYNGFGRVGGQSGGPGRIPVKPGARVRTQTVSVPVAGGAPRGLTPLRARGHRRAHRRRSALAGRSTSTVLVGTKPQLIPFGGPPGPLRLFGKGLGDQGGWLLPFSLLGMIAIAAWIWLSGSSAGASEPRRRDPRLAGLLVLGGWFLTEAVLLSLSKGIVHPYYISALAPGAAAMVGAGAVAFAALAKCLAVDVRRVIAPAAVVLTVWAEIVLLHREHYLHWFIPVLVAAGTLAALALLIVRRSAPWAVAAILCLMLVAPAAYSTTTWHAPVEGTFPAAGPHQATGWGGVGLPHKDVVRDRLLIDYVRSHGATSRWAVLTDASNTAAPLILLGLKAGAVAGYSGTDPALDGRGLARLVAHRQARYVVLGGEFASRGGNGATAATLRACLQLPPASWQGAPIYLHSLVLFDCAGRERALAAGPRARA